MSSRPSPHVLKAALERLTYVSEERVHHRPGRDLAWFGFADVVGALLGAQPGESLRLRGWWSSRPQYSRQFEVVSYTTVLPPTVQGRPAAATKTRTAERTRVPLTWV